jgi:hypothetical protein
VLHEQECAGREARRKARSKKKKGKGHRAAMSERSDSLLLLDLEGSLLSAPLERKESLLYDVGLDEEGFGGY